jgi:hypothetical protein
MPKLFPTPIDDDHGSRYTCFMAAGRSIHDCAIIGQRYDVEGFRWDECEHWLIRVKPSGLAEPLDLKRIVLGGLETLTRVWMSPAGRFWVSSMAGKVYEETGDGTYHTHQLPALPSGVWGIDDRCVYAWSETKERLFRWDGARWFEMPCPGGVLMIHGLAPDDLLASGYGGLMWRWDGQRWTDVSIALGSAVPGIHMASRDRAYACGGNGAVAELSPYGAQELARWDEGPLLDVTVLGDDVLLAGSDLGLLRVVPGTNRIEEVSTDFSVDRFDRHPGGLLISAVRGVVETADGKSFGPSLSMEVLREERRRYPPLWA